MACMPSTTFVFTLWDGLVHIFFVIAGELRVFQPSRHIPKSDGASY